MDRRPTYQELEQRIRQLEEKGAKNEPVEGTRIRVSGIEVEWYPEQGVCTFENLPVAMMWVDSTLAGLMAGVQSMVGTGRFGLALQSEGRKSVEADWQVMSSFPDFGKGFKAIANIASVAGWGYWELVSLDEERRECRFRVKDSWEGRYQKALGVSWGSAMLAGKMAGYCSKLFGANCWADQVAFIAKGDDCDEFVVRPSSRSLEKEIEDLLESDEATRADMAVAVRKLKEEISERKRTEEALRESEARLKRTQEIAKLGSWELVLANNELTWSDEVYRIFGLQPQEFAATYEAFLAAVHPDDRAAVDAAYSGSVSERRDTYEIEHRIVRKSTGEIRHVHEKCDHIRDRAGRIVRSVGMVQDITERKQAEEALRESEERFRKIFKDGPVGVVLTSRNLEFVDANPAFCRMLGYQPEELIGKTFLDITHPEHVKSDKENMEKMWRGELPRYRTEKRYVAKNGDIRWVGLSSSVIRGSDGEPLYALAMIEDITERKQAEEELRASEEKLKAAFEGSHDAVILTTKDGQFLDCNQRALEMFGLAGKEGFKGIRPPDLSPEYQPDGRKSNEEALEHVDQAIRERFSHFEWLHQRSTGEIIPTEIILTSYPLGGEMALQATVRDISERKKAEEEKDRLQAQLLQAQKMESVGRLAGGVAHDFNNMLGIIMGNAELAALQVDSSDPIYQNLHEILKASQRSADTVKQLLAFARKQTISPKVLDLNDTVSGMLRMLQRLIGEDIDLAWLPGHGLWPVKIDPSQVNQILANLAVNARDAIAGVGKVTIETDNVTIEEGYCADHKGFLPGQYVLLAVSDSGTGMPKEVLEHLFEPFFTTKGVGKGTGLGLSTIYGIVKQNNGFVNVYSELGQGTACKIYLPRLESGPLETKVEREPETLRRGTEIVLMVEDEDAILRMGKAMLEELGYRVLTATTPGEAIRMVEKQGREIQLLVSDVVMPEMNGRDLADRLKAINPGLKCLYMSGYTSNVIAHHGVLDEGVVFIQKPFSTRELALKVREVLDKG